MIDGTSMPVSAFSASSRIVSRPNASSDEPANSSSGSMMRSESTTGRKWLDALPSRYTVSIGTSRVVDARRAGSAAARSARRRSARRAGRAPTAMRPDGMPRSPVCVSLSGQPAASRNTPRATALPARERSGTRPENERQPRISVGVPRPHPRGERRRRGGCRRRCAVRRRRRSRRRRPGASASAWSSRCAVRAALPRFASCCSTVAPDAATRANVGANAGPLPSSTTTTSSRGRRRRGPRRRARGGGPARTRG